MTDLDIVERDAERIYSIGADLDASTARCVTWMVLSHAINVAAFLYAVERIATAIERRTLEPSEGDR